jgi:septum formation protein
MLREEIKGRDIILASRSPRRRELLSGLGISFRVVVPGISEDYPDRLKREEIALYLAEKKAGSVINEEKARGTDLLVIASDTIVCQGDTMLGKPSGRDEALNTLRQLSGKMHSVITAVCISNGSRMKSFCSETQVYFTELQDEEMEYYVDNFRPFDKAGSYGIQEWIGYIGVERIEGSYFNVMGLPLQRLYKELKNFYE